MGYNITPSISTTASERTSKRFSTNTKRRVGMVVPMPSGRVLGITVCLTEVVADQTSKSVATGV